LIFDQKPSCLGSRSNSLLCARYANHLIEAESNSGDITLNGAAARKAQVGDPLIICAYAILDTAEASQHKPKIILVDSKNRIKQRL
jgi:aspartate 1-decarboxylase